MYKYSVAFLVLCALPLTAGSKGSKEKKPVVVQEADNVQWALPDNFAWHSPDGSKSQDQDIIDLMAVNARLIATIDTSEDQSYFKTLKPFADDCASLNATYAQFNRMPAHQRRQEASRMKGAILASNKALAIYLANKISSK